MELRDYIRVARRWAWVAGLCIVGFGLAALAVTTQLTRVYRAEAIVLVNQTQSPASITYQDVLGSQQLANTYARLAVTDTNLERAIASLGNSSASLDDLRKDASASVARDTQLISIAVVGSDPQLAAELANAIATSLPDYIREAQLAGQTDAEVPLNSVFVAQRARVPDNPISPNALLITVLGIVVGGIVGIAVVSVLEYTIDSIDGPNDVEAAGATLLGSVWRVPVPSGASKDTWKPSIDADSVLRESLGRVQANLAFALAASGAQVVLVTSPQPGDGKTTIAVNLASSLANSARRVLLIDGDLRQPTVHRHLPLHNASGLSSAFLLGPDATPSLVRAVSDSLHVLTAGPIPPNPMELLSSERLAQVLGTLTPSYDLVIVDAPPVLGIADATLWANNVDAVLLVVRRGKTTRGQLMEALKALRSAQKPLLGVVLNAARLKRSNGYYGYESYGYRQPRPARGARHGRAAPQTSDDGDQSAGPAETP